MKRGHKSLVRAPAGSVPPHFPGRLSPVFLMANPDKSPCLSFSGHLQAIRAAVQFDHFQQGMDPELPEQPNRPTGSHTRAESWDATQTFVSRSWVTWRPARSSEIPRRSGLTSSGQMFFSLQHHDQPQPPENKNPEITNRC